MKHNAKPWTDKQSSPYLDRDKLDTLYEKFWKLAKEEFGIDNDGDLPLDIRIVDRTRYEMMHFMPVPYDHNVVTNAEHDSVLRALMCNLSIASESLSRWHRCLGHNPRTHSATDENLASENRQLVERNKTVENELTTMRREHAVQIRRDETVKSARAQRDLMSNALHHLWGCKVKDCKECKEHVAKQHLESTWPVKKPRKKT